MTRVLHVVRQFRPAIGGLEESVHRLCRALNGKVSIEVLTLDRIFGERTKLPAFEIMDGLPVHRIGWTGSRRYPIAPGVLAKMRQADIAHIHGIDFFFDFLAATKAIHRKPLIASTHGGFFHTSFARRAKQIYFRTVTAASIRSYEAVCASGDSDYELFTRISPRVLRIGNGVDSGKWRGLASLSLTRTLIYFGRFSTNKGIDRLFTLLAKLRDRGGWTLILAGSPWDVSVEDLGRMAAAAGVGDAVEIIARPSDEQIGQAIARASFYASASGHEGFGISVVEAMSAGLYPILSDIGAFRALQRRSGEGLILPDWESPGADEVEDLFTRLSASSAWRDRLLAAAREYDWNNEAAKLHAVYERVREENSSPRIAAFSGNT